MNNNNYNNKSMNKESDIEVEENKKSLVSISNSAALTHICLQNQVFKERKTAFFISLFTFGLFNNAGYSMVAA